MANAVLLLSIMLPQDVVEAELARRRAPVLSLFPAQQDAAEDVARFKAIRTPRRAGKSTTILSRFLEQGMLHPGSRFPYIMLTRGQCKDVAWPILKDLNAQFHVGAKFNETELYMVLPNGSSIHMYGADKPGWMSRMRGQRNRGCAVDEAQDFSINLENMVHQVLRPTLLDLQGELFLGGTPGIIRAGFFFEVTQETGKYHGWKVFKWSTKDNPFVRDQYLEELEQIKAENPGVDIMDLPWVRRELFGEYAEDETDAVYYFQPGRNSTYEWHRQPGDEYICGIDLGWHDRTAFVVCCVNRDSPDFTVLESFRQPKMKLDDACRILSSYEDEYPGIRYVADPARRQLLEELQLRADITINPAEKQEKFDWIELVNRDLVSGRYKILRPDKSRLAEEMIDLKWRTTPSGKREEHPSLPNDCCDAALYAFRYSYHYRYQEKAPRPKIGSPEYFAEEARRLKAEAIRRVRDQQDAQKEWWD